MNRCRNPECNKEIANNLHYCSEDCVRRYQEIKRLEKEKETANGIEENKESSVNTGTQNKALLQDQTIILFKKYPKQRTAKQYACILSWDIRVSQRTALENYIEPMIERGILIVSSGNRYRLNPDYEKE